MKRRSIALLCAVLALLLAGCGAARGERSAPASESAPTAAAAAGVSAEPAAPEVIGAEASFPLLAAPFPDAESEAMVNHNARRCALIVVDRYYCRRLCSDGSCELVRYEIVDNNLRSRVRLAADCPADFLCESEGRLYYLNAAARPESVGCDGGELRLELDEPCLSLQLRDGTLYCLREDGTLLALRGGAGEALLGGCGWAFVSSQGIFYTAASDGRVHLFDPASRTDVTLTSEAASAPTVIGTTLYYTAPAEGRLYALELTDGTRRRMERSFGGTAEFLRGWDGGWQLRLTALGGAAGQQTLALSAAFDAAPAIETDLGTLRRCRGLDDALHTDELLSDGGSSLGFELVIPGSGGYRMLAADNPPEK